MISEIILQLRIDMFAECSLCVHIQLCSFAIRASSPPAGLSSDPLPENSVSGPKLIKASLVASRKQKS